jgi:hypothetical protein
MLLTKKRRDDAMDAVLWHINYLGGEVSSSYPRGARKQPLEDLIRRGLAERSDRTSPNGLVKGYVYQFTNRGRQDAATVAKPRWLL